MGIFYVLLRELNPSLWEGVTLLALTCEFLPVGRWSKGLPGELQGAAGFRESWGKTLVTSLQRILIMVQSRS